MLAAVGGIIAGLAVIVVGSLATSASGLNAFSLFTAFGVVMLIGGAFALWGGIQALKAEKYGWALFGSICAIPAGGAGIIALILIAVSKDEFRD